MTNYPIHLHFAHTNQGGATELVTTFTMSKCVTKTREACFLGQEVSEGRRQVTPPASADRAVAL